MRGRTRRHAVKNLVERLLTVVLVVGPLTLAALWLAFQHKPGWYHPVKLDEAGAQRARSRAVSAADYVSDQMVARRPFDVLLSDRSVTEWLAALPTVWPDARDVLPRQVSDPALRFDDGRIRIAAYYSGRRWQAILSVDLELRVSDDGSDLLIAAKHVRGGSLPLPRAVFTAVLDQLANMPHDARDAFGDVAETLLSTLERVESIDELFEGVRIKNRFVWFNGRRPFRIDSIHIDAGELRLRIEPL